MESKFRYITFFKTPDVERRADLIAINTNDGRYYVRKYRYGIEHGYMSNEKFLEILSQCKNPIVLNADYIGDFEIGRQ